MKAKNILNCLLLLLSLAPYTATSQIWSAPVRVIDPNSGTGAFSGNYSKLLVVNGRPAMADNASGHLRYLRASNASGSGPWVAITVDTTRGTGAHLSLQIVNGIPAISYFDGVSKDLKFVRATDASGTTWGTPIVIDAGGDVGLYTSLQTFNSRAQIAYYDATNGNLKYVRATNFDATTWGAPVIIDASDDVGQFASLQAINGIPAVAYYDVTNGDLKYAVSSDLNGNPPWSISVLDANGDVGMYASLHEVNGQAAVSYYNYQPSFFGTTGVLQYISGGSPIQLDGGTASASIDVGRHTSLQIVAGNPAISYLDSYNSRLKYIRANNAAGSDWSVPPIIADSSGGFFSSLQVVDGRPAIASQDQPTYDLQYVRATDATGSGWGTPVTHDVAGPGEYTSLQIVNGNPAIAYLNSPVDYSPGSLKYVRATNAFGTAWDTIVTVDATEYAGRDNSLQVVNGNPAISYTNQSGHLKYVRSNDALGSTWNLPTTLDLSGQYTSLQIVNGNPAISYYAYDYPNGHLKYIRALDASGTSWGTPAFVYSGDVGQYTSLQVINGNPAISFYNVNSGSLVYVRATNASGTAWGSPKFIDVLGNVGQYTSLQTVNGHPAIAYYDEVNGDLKYIRASDSTGNGPWGTPTKPDVIGDVGKYTSLQVVKGIPAISYFDNTSGNLKYVTANDSSGTSWGTPSTLAPGGKYTSMLSTATDVLIAFQNTVDQLPYFVSGALGGVYYRTRQSGNWNDVGTWESSTVSDFSSAVVSPAVITPDFTSNTITILNGHTVTVTGNITTDQTTVNNGGAITVNNTGSFFINDGVGFDITVDGSLTVQPGGNMTIKSGSSGSASVGTSSGTINGNVTVERYISNLGRRALRLLAIPTTGNQTIRDAWQEGGVVVNNLGTQITSPLFNGSNGFDASSGLPSIFIFNQAAPSGTAWTSQQVTNTNVKRLDSEPGYLLMVFGDRNAGPSNTLHDATTLRSTGVLRQGTQPAVVVPSTGDFTLLSNPYASPIDFESIAGTTNLAPCYYMYDASLTGRFNIGGFRLVERTGPNTYQHTPVLGGVPTLDNTMRYINSGQAFLLKTAGPNAASVVITEASKTSLLPNVNAFRTQNTQPQLLANLLVVATDTIALADGIRIRFDNAYSASVTAEDITKMSNFSENLASLRQSKLLIVEKRPEIITTDTIYLHIANMQIRNYRLQIKGENMPANIMAVLHDNFTGVQTAVNLTSDTNVDFGVTSDSASFASNRFKIVLQHQGALPVTFTSVKAYQQSNNIAVEWKVQNETAIKYYEVEKSTNGITFNKVYSQSAIGNNVSTVNYSWIEVHAATGHNFYRIRSVGLSGEVKYSPVVKVTVGKGKADYQVYPNPVAGNAINLQFINQPGGLYHVRLINRIGQVIFSIPKQHNGGSSTETIELNSFIQKGLYVLEVSAPDKGKRLLKIIY